MPVSVACTSWQMSSDEQQRVDEPLGMLDQPQQRRGRAGGCSLGEGLRLDLAHPGERRLGHGEEADDRGAARRSTTSIAQVGSRELGGEQSRLLLTEARRRWGRASGALRAALAPGPASRPPRRGRRGHGRARGGRRARRAARARRRGCRRGRAPCASATAGQTTTSPSSSGMSSGSGGGAVGPGAAGVGPSDQLDQRRRRSGTTSTSVGPVVAHEPLVQLGDRRLVDEQQRQLGVAPHALGERAPPRPARAQRATSTGDARPARRRTNTSSSPSPPTGAGSSEVGRVAHAARLAARLARLVGPLVGGDDVGDDRVAHDVGAGRGARRRGRRCRRASARARAGRCGRRARRPGWCRR